jgi:hypothetical protein
MKYRSPDLDKLSRKELIEVIDELKSFGIKCPSYYLDRSTSELVFALTCLQDGYTLEKVKLYTVDAISFGCAEIVVMFIPGLNKAFWQNFNEFSEYYIHENILLTKHWEEIPSKVYQSLVECDCLNPYSVLSDDTFNDITDFTVHYRLDDLKSR